MDFKKEKMYIKVFFFEKIHFMNIHDKFSCLDHSKRSLKYNIVYKS